MAWYSFCRMEQSKAFVDMVVTRNIWTVTILLVKFLALLMHLIGRYLMDTKN